MAMVNLISPRSFSACGTPTLLPAPVPAFGIYGGNTAESGKVGAKTNGSLLIISVLIVY